MIANIIYRLSRIDGSIRAKNTGTPKELAKKLRLSERGVRKYITLMKDLGAPINFSRKDRSYYYEYDGYFSFNFTKEEDIDIQ